VAKESSTDGQAVGLREGRRTTGAASRGRRVHLGRFRALAVAGSLVLAAVVVPAVPAVAQSKLDAAKSKLQKLNSQVDQQDQQYNKDNEAWKAAKVQLNSLNASIKNEQLQFGRLRKRVAQLAAAAYKSGDTSSVAALAGAKDPQAVLDQVSIFTQLSKNRSDALTDYIASAQRLQREQAQAAQAAGTLAQTKNAADQKRRQLTQSAKQQQKLVDQLGDTTTTSNSSHGSGQTYNGPATGSARAAVSYAYAQLGAPYVFGGSGPYHSGFDCSGLTMMAWKQGGVSLSHYVPTQWDETRRVSRANLQPGDLVFMSNLGHVGIYVGNGNLIHAPQTGEVVSVISLDNSWVAANLVGFGRP
jgi:peptidoglycan DL-endopeptidase CwlO